MSNDLLDQMTDYMKHYIVLPRESDYLVLATWALHTWCFDASPVTPYLYIHSPESGSGKTTTLDVLASLTKNPVTTAEITAPTLMRLVDGGTELGKPTIFYDEVDMVFAKGNSSNRQIQSVLNQGYRTGGKAFRSEGPAGVRAYDAYCPKALAGIANGGLPDTLVTRSIPVTLRRKPVGVKVQPFYFTEAQGNTEALLDAICEWVDSNYEELASYPRPTIDGMPDSRGSEVAWPLVAIADQFGKREVLEAALVEMITEYQVHLRDQDASLDILRSIAKYFDEHNVVKVHKAALLAAVEMADKKGIVDFNKYLAQYGIEDKAVRLGNNVQRGYTLDQFMSEFCNAGLHDGDEFVL